MKLFIKTCVFNSKGDVVQTPGRADVFVHGIDRKIAALCKKNKREGYDRLFETYERYIYGICFRFTNAREDALDLTQEVFIKIYRAMDKFDESKPLLPWIKRITVNTCLNHKRDSSAAALSLSQPIDGDENTLENLLAGGRDVESEVMLSDTRNIIQESIKELPPHMRLAVILRHVKGLSYEEIGEAMASPLGTIKTYLHRGRGILKEKLKRHGVWEV